MTSPSFATAAAVAAVVGLLFFTAGCGSRTGNGTPATVGAVSGRIQNNPYMSAEAKQAALQRMRAGQQGGRARGHAMAAMRGGAGPTR